MVILKDTVWWLARYISNTRTEPTVEMLQRRGKGYQEEWHLGGKEVEPLAQRIGAEKGEDMSIGQFL